MALYWLRKLIAVALSPLAMALALMAPGLFLLWWGRRLRLARLLVTFGALMLLVIGLGYPGKFIVATLEGRFAPLTLPDIPAAARARIRFIVVLGSGHVADPRLGPLAQIDDHSRARLTEAIRLHRRLPKTRLIFSGGPGFDPVPNARVVADAALALGIAGDRLLLEPKPSNTAEEARALGPRLQGAPFILVTSATHLPRAVGVFRKLGLEPIPAPADFRVKQPPEPKSSPDAWLPGADNLALLHTGVYELVGLAFYRFRGYL